MTDRWNPANRAGFFYDIPLDNEMIEIKEITDTHSEDTAIYSDLTEAQLRARRESDTGIFIAESPKVIRVALERGWRPLSLLCEKKHITGDAADIMETLAEMEGNITVYTGPREVLKDLTGYTLTRGVLCAMARRPLASVSDICRNARLIGVLQGITDTTNIGAIFRAASALGADGLVISADTCDPLNRRAVRVSMGTVFTVPWSISADPVNEVASAGFTTAALALSDDSISLDDPLLKECDRLAVVFGTEGDGLPHDVISGTDYVVKIPMYHGVDSLNVASAAAVTFWELRQRIRI